MKLFLRIIRLILKVAFFVLSFGLIAIAIFYPALLREFIHRLKGIVDVIGRWNRPLAFGLGFAESMPLLGMSIPGQNALFVIGGFVAQHHRFRLVVVVSIAIMCGDIVGYILGVRQGEQFIDQFGKYFGVGKTEVHYIGKALDKYGARAIVLSKRNGYARGIIPFIAGTSRMKRSTFMVFNVIGSVVYATGLITLAKLFVGYYERVMPYLRRIMIGLLVIVAVYVWFFKRESLKKYLRDKEKELEEADAVLKEVEHKL